MDWLKPFKLQLMNVHGVPAKELQFKAQKTIYSKHEWKRSASKTALMMEEPPTARNWERTTTSDSNNKSDSDPNLTAHSSSTRPLEAVFMPSTQSIPLSQQATQIQSGHENERSPTLVEQRCLESQPVSSSSNICSPTQPVYDFSKSSIDTNYVKHTDDSLSEDILRTHDTQYAPELAEPTSTPAHINRSPENFILTKNVDEEITAHIDVADACTNTHFFQIEEHEWRKLQNSIEALLDRINANEQKTSELRAQSAEQKLGMHEMVKKFTTDDALDSRLDFMRKRIENTESSFLMHIAEIQKRQSELCVRFEKLNDTMTKSIKDLSLGQDELSSDLIAKLQEQAMRNNALEKKQMQWNTLATTFEKHADKTQQNMAVTNKAIEDLQQYEQLVRKELTELKTELSAQSANFSQQTATATMNIHKLLADIKKMQQEQLWLKNSAPHTLATSDSVSKQRQRSIYRSRLQGSLLEQKMTVKEAKIENGNSTTACKQRDDRIYSEYSTNGRYKEHGVVLLENFPADVEEKGQSASVQMGNSNSKLKCSRPRANIFQRSRTFVPESKHSSKTSAATSTIPLAQTSELQQSEFVELDEFPKMESCTNKELIQPITSTRAAIKKDHNVGIMGISHQTSGFF